MKNNITIAAAGLALLIGAPAFAEPSSEVAFDAPTRALLRSGDPTKGEALAKDQCDKCHGKMGPGVSDDTDDPNLAGQLASYTYKQLVDYVGKQRDDKDMRKRAKKLSDQDMVDLAAWYAAQPLPDPARKNTDQATLRLVYKGDPKRMIKPCGSCHGRSGQGGGKNDAAALTGQRRGYFISTLAGFKEEDRENDIYSRMRLIAEALTEQEIEALADYYAAPDPE